MNLPTQKREKNEKEKRIIAQVLYQCLMHVHKQEKGKLDSCSRNHSTRRYKWIPAVWLNKKDSIANFKRITKFTTWFCLYKRT